MTYSAGESCSPDVKHTVFGNTESGGDGDVNGSGFGHCMDQGCGNGENKELQRFDNVEFFQHKNAGDYKYDVTCRAHQKDVVCALEKEAQDSSSSGKHGHGGAYHHGEENKNMRKRGKRPIKAEIQGRHEPCPQNRKSDQDA